MSVPTVASDLRGTLEAARNADGGWGAYAERPSNTEATALATMALRTHRPDAARAGAAWLAASQRDDGSWSFTREAPDPSWAGSLALLGLAARGGHDAAVRRGVDWLVGYRGRPLPLDARIRYWLWPERQSATLDPDLNGWPWAADTFSWVEPTSYAVLALRRLDPRGRRAAARVREGVAMILDRMCPGGGWNYGNSVVLGEDLEPYPDTTAIALLALQGARAEPAITSSLALLERMVDGTASGLTLALAILCLRAWDRHPGERPALLRARFAETGFLGETRALALAALALEGAPHFRMDAT
jgi:hypothetical protein